MKMIINIDENVYTRLFDNGIPMDIADGIVMERAIRKGTPIPDNATNGDIMQTIFPNGVTVEFATFMRFVVGEDKYINCAYDWWNSPYQKGGKE